MNEAIKIILAKLTSGKFLLTVIAGLVFAIVAIKGAMPMDKVTEIILLIVYAYFTRKGGNGGAGIAGG